MQKPSQIASQMNLSPMMIDSLCGKPFQNKTISSIKAQW